MGWGSWLLFSIFLSRWPVFLFFLIFSTLRERCSSTRCFDCSMLHIGLFHDLFHNICILILYIPWHILTYSSMIYGTILFYNIIEYGIFGHLFEYFVWNNFIFSRKRNTSVFNSNNSSWSNICQWWNSHQLKMMEHLIMEDKTFYNSWWNNLSDVYNILHFLVEQLFLCAFLFWVFFFAGLREDDCLYWALVWTTRYFPIVPLRGGE